MSDTVKKPIHPREWFHARMGKHVKRDPLYFNGKMLDYDKETMKNYGIIRILIDSEDQANYLFDVQNELGARYEES